MKYPKVLKLLTYPKSRQRGGTDRCEYLRSGRAGFGSAFFLEFVLELVYEFGELLASLLVVFVFVVACAGWG